MQTPFLASAPERPCLSVHGCCPVTHPTAPTAGSPLSPRAAAGTARREESRDWACMQKRAPAQVTTVTHLVNTPQITLFPSSTRLWPIKAEFICRGDKVWKYFPTLPARTRHFEEFATVVALRQEAAIFWYCGRKILGVFTKHQWHVSNQYFSAVCRQPLAVPKCCRREFCRAPCHGGGLLCS